MKLARFIHRDSVLDLTAFRNFQNEDENDCANKAECDKLFTSDHIILSYDDGLQEEKHFSHEGTPDSAGTEQTKSVTFKPSDLVPLQKQDNLADKDIKHPKDNHRTSSDKIRNVNIETQNTNEQNVSPTISTSCVEQSNINNDLIQSVRILCFDDKGEEEKKDATEYNQETKINKSFSINEKINVRSICASKTLNKKKHINGKNKENATKKVRFSSQQRVKLVASKKSLPKRFKEQIWWNREDYVDFKKTIGIISQDLPENICTDSWFLGAQDTRFRTPHEKSIENEHGKKWWCQYGHSRRGLEQLVASHEGKCRQDSVSRSFALVMCEQTRQVLQEKRDQRKLSMAAKRYTSFARDLALASGRADRDAVKFDFDLKKMKTYHYYLPSKYLHDEFFRCYFGVPETLENGNTDVSQTTAEEDHCSEFDLFS